MKNEKFKNVAVAVRRLYSGFTSAATKGKANALRLQKNECKK